jgi:hypothetical protein
MSTSAAERMRLSDGKVSFSNRYCSWGCRVSLCGDSFHRYTDLESLRIAARGTTANRKLTDDDFLPICLALEDSTNSTVTEVSFAVCCWRRGFVANCVVALQNCVFTSHTMICTLGRSSHAEQLHHGQGYGAFDRGSR